MCSRDKLGFPHFLVLLAILQLVFTCLGCSVKEDRDLCPCILEIDVRNAEYQEDSVLLLIDGISGNAAGTHLKDAMVGSWRSQMPKGGYRVSVVWPNGDWSGDSDKLVEIRPGHDCPEVWLSSEEISARKDYNVVPVTLRKSYCNLSIIVSSDFEFRYRLEVRGNVDGYNADGTPSEGSFVAPASYGEDGGGLLETHVNIPRQTDSSLRLDIISEDEQVHTFAIGNYIEASGYDWTSPDLKDITLEIDFALSTISFSIDRWSETYQFEVVI